MPFGQRGRSSNVTGAALAPGAALVVAWPILSRCALSCIDPLHFTSAMRNAEDGTRESACHQQARLSKEF
jgi:hypothetical protein